MSGRFPGARDVSEFWDNLLAGRESITVIPPERLIAHGIHSSAINDPNYVCAKGIFTDADLFDASFFGFSPRQAQCLDPQHRVFLEECWAALESAGYGPGTFDGAIGLYAGTTLSRYLPLVLENEELVASVGTFQLLLDNDKDHLPTRVAFKLGLRGPCVNVQSACSTSLLAVHFAIQSILAHECDLALAGGVAISVPLESGYSHQPGGILSPDGHCRPFDAHAQGTVVGNGAGVVVLRRLNEATDAGDTIHAVILGSAVNNDGERRAGYTAPGVDGQVEVITAALAMADVDAATIAYVEAHGSGTPLGDRIEMVALKRAHRTAKAKRSCAVGSVKANIGHLDAAAGIAGLIKAVHVVKHGVIPPAINCIVPIEEVGGDNGRFFINATRESWPVDRLPRRAGVSSSGLGGTNVHLILEQSPPQNIRPSNRRWVSIMLSARTEPQLDAAADRLANHMKLHPGCSLSDVAYTLQVGRAAFGHRMSLPCSSMQEAIEQLKSAATRTRNSCSVPRVAPHVGFLLPGLGDHYQGMGYELYRTEPEFRCAVDECDEILRRYGGGGVRAWLYPEDTKLTDFSSGIDLRSMIEQANTDLVEPASIAHPALFAVEYAQARMWMRWGVQPKALLGYSLGEIVAACLSGVLKLADALQFVSERAALIDGGEPGMMLAICSNAQQMPPLPKHVSIAGYLTNDMTVIAGPCDAMEIAKVRLAEFDITTRQLRAGHAYHTLTFAAAAEQLLPLLQSFDMSPPAIPWVSNVTGKWIDPSEAVLPQYWTRQLCSPVRFDQGVRSLLFQCNILLVTGPGSSLGSLAKRVASQIGAPIRVINSTRASYDHTPDDRELAVALGELWRAGADVNWRAYWGSEHRRRIELPTYPFDRKRHWVPLHSRNSRFFLPARPRESHTEDASRWFYMPCWRRAPLPLSPGMAVEEPCLLFTSQFTACERIEQSVSGVRNVIRVLPGAHFERAPDGGYIVEPGRADDYDRLLQELAESASTPKTIIHLWGLEPRASIQDNCRRTFVSAIQLAQSLDRRFHIEPINIIFVTEPSGPIAGTEDYAIEKASLAVAATVISQEYPYLSCRVIEAHEPDLAALMRELTGLQTPVVRALFGAERFVRAYEPLELQSVTDCVRLTNKGHYAVLGGTGLIGRAIAQYLAQTSNATLTLIARRPAPESLVSSLHIGGSKILSLQADVSVPHELIAALRTAENTFGEIRGVFHAAGVVGDAAYRLISELDEHSLFEQLMAKARGLQALDDTLRGRSCDFCVVVSSLSPMLGGIGLCGYAAVSAYVDAFVEAQARYGSGVRWTSINWEGWQKDDRAPVGQMVTREQGQDSLHRVLSHSYLPRVLIARGDWERRRRDAMPQLKGAQPGRRAMASRSGMQRAMNPIEIRIASIWREVLGLEEVGIDENFFDLGGDSLLATRVAARLRNVFQMQLSLRILLNAKTITQLADVIVERMTGAIGTTATNELLRTVQGEGS
jgi:acyl transferase domain-containing protein/acyl carrier protein